MSELPDLAGERTSFRTLETGNEFSESWIYVAYYTSGIIRFGAKFF